MASIDSKSLYQEAKAAGVIYQAVVRHELHEAIGPEWNAVDGHSGMAEMAGVTQKCLNVLSARPTGCDRSAGDPPTRRDATIAAALRRVVIGVGTHLE